MKDTTISKLDVYYHNYDKKLNKLIRFFAGKPMTLAISSRMINTLEYMAVISDIYSSHPDKLLSKSRKICTMDNHSDCAYRLDRNRNTRNSIIIESANVSNLRDCSIQNGATLGESEIKHCYIKFYEKYSRMVL